MEDIFRNLPKFQLYWTQIEKLIDEWARAYDVPRDEILRQLPWAHGWILSNPAKAPKKNVVRFLFNWMRKANQMGTLKKARVPEKRPEASPVDTTTLEDLLWMHQEKIKALGPCRVKGCELCPELLRRAVAV